ncbi:MAG: hypothetical protein P1U86_19615 [Verrucomicrobiales bacterium]|nr:hypothetical protein [Verrucomicrobiales bacterium]
MEIAQAGKLSGASVEKVELSDHGELVLQFCNASETLRIPMPWTFTSCLESVNSEASGRCDDITQSLIGLEGAQLTGIESDANHIDLHFGSITISAPA